MTRCPRCGAPNGCAMAATAGAVPAADTATPCWCAGMAVAPAHLACLRAASASAAGSCYCRACLCAEAAPPGDATTAAAVASTAVVR